MTMPTLAGKMPGLVAGVVILGGLPLLAFMLLFSQLMTARTAGHAGGDALGLAILSVLAYGLAFASFAIGAAYFGFQFARHKLRPQEWHKVVLAWASLDLAAPPLYFLIT